MVDVVDVFGSIPNRRATHDVQGPQARRSAGSLDGFRRAIDPWEKVASQVRNLPQINIQIL